MKRSGFKPLPKAGRRALIQKADKLLQRVALKLSPTCQYPGCNNESTEGHHVIHRRNHALRWVLANVPALCHYHHGWDDSASKKSKLLQGLIERMGGQTNYDALVLYSNTADSERPEDAINRLKKVLDKYE